MCVVSGLFVRNLFKISHLLILLFTLKYIIFRLKWIEVHSFVNHIVCYGSKIWHLLVFNHILVFWLAEHPNPSLTTTPKVLNFLATLHSLKV